MPMLTYCQIKRKDGFPSQEINIQIVENLGVNVSMPKIYNFIILVSLLSPGALKRFQKNWQH